MSNYTIKQAKPDDAGTIMRLKNHASYRESHTMA